MVAFVCLFVICKKKNSMDVDLSKELASSSKPILKGRLDTSKSEAKKQMVRLFANMTKLHYC